jgi:hypothetical protein
MRCGIVWRRPAIGSHQRDSADVFERRGCARHSKHATGGHCGAASTDNNGVVGRGGKSLIYGLGVFATTGTATKARAVVFAAAATTNTFFRIIGIIPIAWRRPRSIRSGEYGLAH